MPTPPRAYEARTCPICGHTWTPHRYREARRTTCSAVCAGRLSGEHRGGGLKRAQTSDPRGRVCTRCGLWRGWAAFAWTVAGKRRTAWCRACVSSYNGQYRRQYHDSLLAEKRAAYAAGRWSHTGRVSARLRKMMRALDRRVERVRDCSHLVGAYFGDVLAGLQTPDPNSVPHPDDKEDLHLWARQCLAWLLRTHVYLSWEQIGAMLRRPVDLVRRWVVLVRRRIRQSHWTPLAGHAQELLRQAREMHPSAAEQKRQRRAEQKRQGKAPTDSDAYWTKRRAMDARERRYG